MALNPYIAGSLIAGIIVFVLLLCLRLCLFHFQQFKAYQKRRATPFYLLGGTEINPLTSCNEITVPIGKPEKSITRNPYPYGLPDEAGVSSELIPFPSSSTLSLHAPPRSPAMSIHHPVHLRHSRSSSGFSGYTMHNQYRFPPGLPRSSRLSFTSFMSPLRAKPVLQPFEPTLPDELTLRADEYITVLRSFDDGWCVVARDTSRSSRHGVSLLPAGTKTNGEDNVDIGIVPAWVFAEPLEGVAFMRPFRSTSLNALRFGQNPAYARDTIVSLASLA